MTQKYLKADKLSTWNDRFIRINVGHWHITLRSVQNVDYTRSHYREESAAFLPHELNAKITCIVIHILCLYFFIFIFILNYDHPNKSVLLDRSQFKDIERKISTAKCFLQMEIQQNKWTNTKIWLWNPPFCEDKMLTEKSQDNNTSRK